MTVYAKCDKSGWTWRVLPLSEFNFDRLNHDITGAPRYHCQDRLWPAPVSGISVIWDKAKLHFGDLNEQD